VAVGPEEKYPLTIASGYAIHVTNPGRELGTQTANGNQLNYLRESMIEIDNKLEQFKGAIDFQLKRVPLPQSDKQDLRQDCYVALLENLGRIQSAPNPSRYANRVCWTCVVDYWRKRNGTGQVRRPVPGSLSDPKNYSQACRVLISDNRFPLDDLDEGLMTLPLDVYGVIYDCYVEGMTEGEAAESNGINLRRVKYLKNKGVSLLKKFFSVA
jgi:DNA-directed RNA polymerase specialized sigma24 family protein